MGGSSPVPSPNSISSMPEDFQDAQDWYTAFGEPSSAGNGEARISTPRTTEGGDEVDWDLARDWHPPYASNIPSPNSTSDIEDLQDGQDWYTTFGQPSSAGDGEAGISAPRMASSPEDLFASQDPSVQEEARQSAVISPLGVYSNVECPICFKSDCGRCRLLFVWDQFQISRIRLRPTIHDISDSDLSDPYDLTPLCPEDPPDGMV